MYNAHVRRFWAASGHVIGGHGLRRLLRRAQFVVQAQRHKAALAPLLSASPTSLLGRTVAARPAVLGFFCAPYICKNWGAAERIRAFTEDLEVAERLGPLFEFDPSEQIDLMPLEHLGSGFWLVVDKPVWFHREGVSTLNLFRDGTRLFSVAFSMRRNEQESVATIGGIQGRNLDGMLDLYRDMTKASAGVRPRDLIIEMFRMLCRALGVTRILAVSDAARHHRSAFFDNHDGKLSLDYDEVWTDRGGLRVNEDFFELPVARQHRDENDIPAKKRGLYRKRYELLDQLEGQLREALSTVLPQPISRKD